MQKQVDENTLRFDELAEYTAGLETDNTRLKNDNDDLEKRVADLLNPPCPSHDALGQTN